MLFKGGITNDMDIATLPRGIYDVGSSYTNGEYGIVQYSVLFKVYNTSLNGSYLTNYSQSKSNMRYFNIQLNRFVSGDNEFNESSLKELGLTIDTFTSLNQLPVNINMTFPIDATNGTILYNNGLLPIDSAGTLVVNARWKSYAYFYGASGVYFNSCSNHGVDEWKGWGRLVFEDELSE